jgi:hypothetical protein
MIKERDIKRVYKIAYKIAEEVGDSIYTKNMSWQVYHLLTDQRGIPPIETHSVRERLAGLAVKVDKVYNQKFRELADKQKTLEGIK